MQTEQHRPPQATCRLDNTNFLQLFADWTTQTSSSYLQTGQHRLPPAICRLDNIDLLKLLADWTTQTSSSYLQIGHRKPTQATDFLQLFADRTTQTYSSYLQTGQHRLPQAIADWTTQTSSSYLQTGQHKLPPAICRSDNADLLKLQTSSSYLQIGQRGPTQATDFFQLFADWTTQTYSSYRLPPAICRSDNVELLKLQTSSSYLQIGQRRPTQATDFLQLFADRTT